MFRTFRSAVMAAVIGLACAALAEYVIIPVEAPVAASSKPVPTHNIQVAKVIAVEAEGVVSNKTITISRVIPGATNTVSTLTTSVTTGGRQTFDLSSSGYYWMQKGESWQRAGTETNATLRIIIEQ